MLRTLFKPALILAALVGGTGMLLPEKYAIERSLEMHGVPYDLYSEVSDLSTWQEWSPWSAEIDSGVQYTLSNDPEGEGAFLRFRSPKFGRGEFRVLSVDEEAGVEINWIHADNQLSRHSFRASEASGKVRMLDVTWTISGTSGMNPLRRWRAFLMNERYLGKRMEEALTRLRKRMKEL